MRTNSTIWLLLSLGVLVVCGCHEAGDAESVRAHGRMGFASTAPMAPPLSPDEQQALRFGLDSVAGLVVESGAVGKGQSLSHILSPKNVGTQVLHRIATEYREVYDVRNMRAGKEWHLFRSKEDGAPQHFAYAISDREYVVFGLTEAGGARMGEFPIEVRRDFVEGSLDGSLYLALEQAGHPSNLALAMAQVYQWTIDFSRIQAGDQFRILYERDWVDDNPTGMPRVLAAEFVHRGRNFPAFLYDQGEGLDYFDDAGASLRKAFLKAPVEFSRISSRFNKKRFHPVLNKVKAHLGTDYAAPHGTPIVSVGDGVVIKSSYTKGNGKYVKVRHNGTYTTQYLHMSRRAVKEGQAVRQGDIIGYVGSTGLATGPHVCFRFWKNGQQVDHMREEFPPSTPIAEDHITHFAGAMATWLEEMGRRSGESSDVQLAVSDQ